VPRFQLVFRHSHGDRTQLHDKANGEPMVNGQLLTNGAFLDHAGITWEVERADHDGLTRFVCTPMPESAESQK
jgi:hypothetical protein